MDKRIDPNKQGPRPGETYKGYVERLSVDQLKAEQKSLSFVIDKLECFGVRDCVLLDWIELELLRREGRAE